MSSIKFHFYFFPFLRVEWCIEFLQEISDKELILASNANTSRGFKQHQFTTLKCKCVCVCSPPSYSFMLQVKLTSSIIINQKMEPPDGYLNKCLNTTPRLSGSGRKLEHVSELYIQIWENTTLWQQQLGGGDHWEGDGRGGGGEHSSSSSSSSYTGFRV